MGFLTGKKALITGVLSNKSIAYGIAKAMHQQGAELAFTYVGEKFADRVAKLAKNFDVKLILPLDVTSDQEIAAAFKSIKDSWQGLDILVHAIAFAPGDHLEGDYVENTTRDGFKMAHDISVYSFTALAKAAQPLMAGRNGSMLTLSYMGSEKVMPNYNIMGVAKASLEASVRYTAASLGPQGTRVNAISAGPVRTLAASGISGFRAMLDYNKNTAPLRQNITSEQVGNAAAFLCSDLASGITGEILHVDAGYNIMGMGNIQGKG
ncbi:MAG: enoyl-[acyl-carrier-protein] reductase FabI [Legionellales bacterium]|nr:MAG: enoyl-[acyl-carrier-protein] reductase FabI [Legionellales bacterium]